MSQVKNPLPTDQQIIQRTCEEYREWRSKHPDAMLILDDWLKNSPAGLQDELVFELLKLDISSIPPSNSDKAMIGEYLGQNPEQAASIKAAYRRITPGIEGTRDADLTQSPTRPSHLSDTNKAKNRSEQAGTAATIPPLTPGTQPVTLRPLDDAPELLAGATIEMPEIQRRYHIEKEIGRGGMGIVYQVRDDKFKRYLAMKLILGQQRGGSSNGTQASVMQRFVREARITGELDHHGVVPVHDVGQDAHGRLYFTMKFVEGETLTQVIEDVHNGRNDWTIHRAVDVLIRVCETLAFSHSKRVIHRDLKPSNVMVGKFGEAYLMDWGLAKELGIDDPQDELLQLPISDDQLRTMYGHAVGTPNYMPPEQAGGKIDQFDERSDVYSMGAILYQLTSGIRPYEDTEEKKSDSTCTYDSKAEKEQARDQAYENFKRQEALVKRVRELPPTDLASLAKNAPPELVAITRKAMQRNKSDRYQSMNELAEDLRAFTTQHVVKAYKSDLIAKARKFIARNQAATITSFLALLSITVGLVATTILQYRHAKTQTLQNRQLEKAIAKTN